MAHGGYPAQESRRINSWQGEELRSKPQGLHRLRQGVEELFPAILGHALWGPSRTGSLPSLVW